MIPSLVRAGALLLIAGYPRALLAQDAVGDPVAGAAHFAEHCVECHVVENAAGEILAGRKPSGAPNLYGVAGRAPGGIAGFFYSQPMRAYGQSGTVWEHDNFVRYVQDPSAFLQEATGESGRSRMPAGMVPDEQAAHDVWAYLETLSLEGDAEVEASAAVEAGSE